MAAVNRHGGRWRVAAAAVVSAALASALSPPARAQAGAVPPDAAAAIRAAVQSGDQARRGAAVTSGVAREAVLAVVIGRAGSRAAESAMVGAVVSSIARHPGAASAIVRAAVAASPRHREAIVTRASAAFPGLAAQIVAGTRPAPPPPVVARAVAPARIAPPPPVVARAVAPARTAPPPVVYAPPDSTREWRAALGIGVGVAPEYPGADEYEVVVVPVIDIAWGDLLFLNTVDGLGFNAVRGRQLRLAVALTYDEGRDEDESDSLRGLGDIVDKIEMRGNAEYILFSNWKVRADIRQDIFGEHEGALIGLGLAYLTRPRDTIALALSGGFTWASEDYMQSFFGVDATQSARSGIAAFAAESGVKDVNMGTTLTYFFTRQWFARGLAKLEFLLGDAADSPISGSDTQFSFGVALGYQL